MTALTIQGILVGVTLTTLFCAPVWSQTFAFQSDQKATSDGAALCLAVDATKPLTPAADARVRPPEGGEPYALPATFFPVVVQRCDGLKTSTPSDWQPSDARELRIVVNKQTMCLSARNIASFTPLLDPFLAAFGAHDATSTLAYLAQDLQPDGVVNAKRLAENPDLVVGPCNRPDTSDFWQYDELSGTISGPNMGGRRQCVAIHGDWSKRPIRHEGGMPVSAANCSNVRTFKRTDNPAQIRWTTRTGSETLPHYPPLPEDSYFGGGEGLPITGPLGRCITADSVSKILVTSDCDGRLEQNWKYSEGAIHFGRSNDCIEVQSDGQLRTAACSGRPEQRWHYDVAQPDPNPSWKTTDVFGQIFSPDGRCLAVRDDPFVDPSRQRNPVRLVTCRSELSRKTSWFVPDHVYTIRFSVTRFSDDDGGNPAMGATSDDAVKSRAETLAMYLSDYYRAIGIRFVFVPASDLIGKKSTAANQMTPNGDTVIQRTAGQEGYGKANISAMLKMGGGSSCWIPADYDRNTVVEPMSGRPRDPKDVLFGYPADLAGLPAYCRVVNESSISAALDNVGHEAHEFGHFFGLPHTFDHGGFLDVPPDTINGTWWHQHSSETCGNIRTGMFKDTAYTPDRTNNESYWGCLVGRAHTSFSPQQLGRMAASLKSLNRYPLVACQPVHAYDANIVECENAESLTLCIQTAMYLKAKSGTDVECRSGGKIARAMASLLSTPIVTFALQSTSEGMAMTHALAGLRGEEPLSLATLAHIVIALQNCENLPLSMAMYHRFTQLQELAATQLTHASQVFSAASGSELSPADQRIATQLVKEVFLPGFITNLPMLSH